uniref:Uncharacterized protein n=1 Tax=Anguilla anguilla TaxID=7936 RepID=A0A0E9U3V1_ANGAN
MHQREYKRVYIYIHLYMLPCKSKNSHKLVYLLSFC